MTISLKRRYSFRLSTTSFIHRAGYADNVRLLAPLLDEIELLFLESRHLPSKTEISELRMLAEQLDVRYNIHLPMDISLADASRAVRIRSRESVLKALELAAPLNPTGYALHVTFEAANDQPDGVRSWQDTATESLSRLLDSADVTPDQLYVETLDFPPHWLAPIVERLNLPICLDVGHVIRFGYDLAAAFKRYEQKIGMFHLHGVSGPQDHCALNELHQDARNLVSRYLYDFHGSVSLEVFSLPDLVDSMTCFEKMMAELPLKSGGSVPEI